MKIVLLGNCQAGALRHLYARFVEPHTRDESSHVASYENVTAAIREKIAAADAVVLQVQDFNAKTRDIALPTKAPIQRFPVVGGTFLWPFSGRERPGNKAEPCRPGGAYPGQLGDSYLNRMIRDGVDPDEAVDRYAALDVSTVIDLDRLYRIALAKQKRMDDALGFEVASIIDENFRNEPLFMTAYHPETRLIKHLAVTVFRAMGVDGSILDRLVRLQRDTSLLSSEAPIHPAVVRHFGLRYVTPDRTYRFHNEGAYSFQEWTHRYMLGTWNRRLAEGLFNPGRRPPEATFELLKQGLELSPRSGPGWAALAQALLRRGDSAGAAEAARKAVELEPDDAALRGALGTILFQIGLHDEAARELAKGLALDPCARNMRRLLPLALSQAGRLQEALDVVRVQIDDPLAPPDSALLDLRARLESRVGHLREALIWAEKAAETKPVHSSALSTLADLLGREGRHREAQFCLRQALELRPDAAGVLFALARSLQTSGDVAAAADAARRAAELAPDKWQFHALLSRVLARLSRYEDAERACVTALALRPDDNTLCEHLTVLRGLRAGHGQVVA